VAGACGRGGRVPLVAAPHRAPASRVVTVCTVVPFLAFAAGIGAGADWSTWH